MKGYKPVSMQKGKKLMTDIKKNKWSKLTVVFILLVSSKAFSAITSGQLTIINGLANETSGGTGSTATSFNVQISDSSGVCVTPKTVLYNGYLIVKWDATKTHTISQCTGIASITLTPLKTTVGKVSTIVYDASTSTSIPATKATAAITYTPPTTPVSNLVLLITGTGTPVSTQSATGTAWGIGAASAPVFNPVNGALITMGVPGGEGLAGFKAEQTARRYGVLPYK